MSLSWLGSTNRTEASASDVPWWEPVSAGAVVLQEGLWRVGTTGSWAPVLLDVAGADDVPSPSGHLLEGRSFDEGRGLFASGESTDNPDQCLADGHDDAELDARVDAPTQGLGDPGCQRPKRDEPDQQKGTADTQTGDRNCPIGLDQLLLGHAP